MDFSTQDIQSYKFTEVPLVEDNLLCFLQELEMLFYTSDGEVLGDEDSWLNLESVLFTKSINEIQFQNMIEEKVRSTCAYSEFFNWTLEIRFVEGQTSDMGVIMLNIDLEDGSIKTSTFVIG